MNFDWLATCDDVMLICCIQSGQTALYWAVYGGYVDIVQMLIDHGAAVDLGRNEVAN
jgi:hypothetical protein